MRTRLLLLMTAMSAACADVAHHDPRKPVALYLRPGEFLRVEFVDSALMASDSLEIGARARALGVWREYGAAGLDSVVVHVSDRTEVSVGQPSKSTLYFRFTNEDLGGAPLTARRHDVDAQPVALEIQPGNFIRAEFVDPAMVTVMQGEHRRDLMLGLARQVWKEHGTGYDSVVVTVSNYPEPVPGVRTSSPRVTTSSVFREDELRDEDASPPEPDRAGL